MVNRERAVDYLNSLEKVIHKFSFVIDFGDVKWDQFTYLFDKLFIKLYPTLESELWNICNVFFSKKKELYGMKKLIDSIRNLEYD